MSATMKCPKCDGEMDVTTETDHSNPDNSVEVRAVCDNEECGHTRYSFVLLEDMVGDDK